MFRVGFTLLVVVLFVVPGGVMFVQAESGMQHDMMAMDGGTHCTSDLCFPVVNTCANHCITEASATTVTNISLPHGNEHEAVRVGVVIPAPQVYINSHAHDDIFIDALDHPKYLLSIMRRE